MSAVIETLICCDGLDCGAMFADGDQRHKSASEQRRSYGLDGWIYRAGKDYCSKCAATAPKAKRTIFKPIPQPGEKGYR